MAIVTPLEGSKATISKESIKENVEEIKETANELGREIRSTLAGEDKSEATNKTHQHRNIIGIILIGLGIFFLLGSLNFFWWFRWGYLWPLILVAIGLIIIFGARKRK